MKVSHNEGAETIHSGNMHDSNEFFKAMGETPALWDSAPPADIAQRTV